MRAYVLSPRAYLRDRVPRVITTARRLHVRLTHVRCTLSTVHCVHVSSAVHAAKRTIVSCASSPKCGECNCSCRHTRQFVVTLSARVAGERTSILAYTDGFIHEAKVTYHVTLRIVLHGNRQLDFSCPKMHTAESHV